MPNNGNNNDDAADGESQSRFGFAVGMPATTKVILCVVTAIFLFSFVSASVGGALMNCVFVTIGQFQIWRVFTAAFFAPKAMSWIFGCLMLVSFGGRVEKTVGSVRYLYMVVVLGVAVQLLYAIIMSTLAYNPVYELSMLMFSCSGGFSSLWLALFSSDCAAHPEEEQKFMCFPFAIKKKYYPLAMVLFFALIFGLNLDSLVAVAVGFMHRWKYFAYFMPTPTRVASLEAGLLRRMAAMDGFAPANFDDEIGFETPQAAAPSSGQRWGGIADPAGRTVLPVTTFPGQGHSLEAGGSAGASSSGASAMTAEERSGDEAARQARAAAIAARLNSPDAV